MLLYADELGTFLPYICQCVVNFFREHGLMPLLLGRYVIQLSGKVLDFNRLMLDILKCCKIFLMMGDGVAVACVALTICQVCAEQLLGAVLN